MSDLPNFHRSWFKRIGPLRVLAVTVAILAAAVAIGFSDVAVGEDIFIKFSKKTNPILIGAPYGIKALVKNDGMVSAKMEIQGIMVAQAGGCVEKDKHIKFSNPVKINVAPNGAVETMLVFDPIQPSELPCHDMSVGLKTFVNVQVDDNSFTTTQNADLSLQIL